jgi:DDE family transposase
VNSFDFGTVEGRSVVGAFDGGVISSDAGALLLGVTDEAIALVDRFAACFRDGRSPELIEPSIETLVRQRVVGIALGYEDLNDHDELRHDPVMAVLAGKLEARRKDCAPVAGKSTLSRLEHAPAEGAAYAPARYHKIGHDAGAIEDLFVRLFLESYAEPPEEIMIDLDATGPGLDPGPSARPSGGTLLPRLLRRLLLYLPLYIFCDRHLLAAKLRRANIDASAGAVAQIARIVAQIRARWPDTRICIRADSGLAREELMAWCEEGGVDYVLGSRPQRPAAGQDRA